MAYSVDFRKKILDAYLKREGTNQEIAERFKISLSTVKRIGQRYRETGKTELYLDNIGRPMKLDEAGIRTLKMLVKQRADSSLDELSRMLYEKTQIQLTAQALHYIFKRLGVSYKKKSYYASQRDRPDVKKKRRVF